MLTVIVRAADGTARTLAFPGSEVNVGRDATNDIALPNGSVSKFHARLSWHEGGCMVEDLGSTNGTTVDGQPIRECVVGPRNAITIGDFVLRVEASRAAPGAPGKSASRPPAARRSEKPAAQTFGNDTIIPPQAMPAATNEVAALPGASRSVRPLASTAASALRTLCDRAARAIDPALLAEPTVPPENLKKVAETVSQLARSMAEAGNLPPKVAPEALADAAVRELAELGPLGALLDDASVTRIQCLRYDDIHVTRGGQTSASGSWFTSGGALRRAVDRLVLRSGKGWDRTELVLERRLRTGGRVLAMAPPLAENVCVTIVPRSARSATMADLLSSGAISKPMLAYLVRAMHEKKNVLVCAKDDGIAGDLLAGLASTLPEDDRVAVVHAGIDLGLGARSVVSLALPVQGADERDVFRAAYALGYERVIVSHGRPELAAKVVEAAAAGPSASIFVVRARTIEEALMTVMSHLSITHPGAAADAFMTLVRRVVDIGIHVTTSLQGELRVSRIAELVPGPTGGLLMRDRFAPAAPAKREPGGAAGEER